MAPRFEILTEQPERSLAFADAFRPLADLVIQLAVKRRADNFPRHDLLGMLMQARDRETGSAMSDRQLAREVMTLVVAGHETTASVLNWTWYLLARHPAVDDELADELSSLGDNLPSVDDMPRFSQTRRIIEEVMRLYPPGWLLTRKALADDHVGGYLVPAGTEIYIAPYLIQRHPKLWQEPDRFNPDRFSADSRNREFRAMLPFSIGPRNCIGEYLARLEMQIHLMMVGRVLRLRLVDETHQPKLAAGVNLLSRDDFLMTAEFRARFN
jgi:cytochrome P450